MAPRFTINGVQYNQREKFRSQESLEDFPKLRQFFLLIVAFFILSHTALNITAPDSTGSNPPRLYLIISYTFPVLSVIICIFTYSSLFSSHTTNTKSSVARSLLNFFAAVILAFYLILFCEGNTTFEPIKKPSDDWLSNHTVLSESFYILFIFLAVCSTFVLRAVIAVLYYVVISALYIEASHPSFWWMISRNACSCVLVIALLGLKSGFRWRSFLKFSELEEWNKVYRDILERNPSCIAVVNAAGKVVYSNHHFHEMAQDNPEAFFQSVTNLRSRDLLNTPDTNYQGVFNFNMNSLSPHPLSHVSSEECLIRRQNSLHSTPKKGLMRMSTKIRMNTVHSFANLWQLLCFYRTSLDKETLEKDANLVFDGKTMGRMDITEQPRSKDIGVGTLDRDIRRGSTGQQVNTFEIIIRPCTEYKKLIVILNNTTERDLIVGLENSSDYKDKILASVSHELRTPLNGNLGCLQAALNDRTVPEYVKSNLLVPAFRSGKLLLHVIDDIMDYSQLQSKGIRLKVEPKSLAETFNYCYELVEHSFKSKGLKLRLKLNEDLPKLFSTDHTRLKQIILNLLTNAIKFTQQGGVTIRASCAKNSKIEIKVEDTGMGIKPESIRKLFGEQKSHHVVPGFKEVESKGVGLGLKISQKLAELLSDEPDNEAPIQVHSVYGQGSSFVFLIKEITETASMNASSVSLDRNQDNMRDLPDEHRLSIESLMESVVSQGEVPVERLNDYEKTVQESAKNYFQMRRPVKSDTTRRSLLERRRTICTDRGTDRGLMQGMKVLIVDDDPLNILVLESFVAQFGLQSDSAHNGKEAMEKVMKSPEMYKLILMDCQMPIMDGFEATRLLNKKMEEGKIPMIPIIGCTAFSSKDKLRKCIKAGMKEVLPKPVMKDQIGDVLKSYLGLGFK